MKKRIPKPVSVKKELHICPQCGYDDGFHTSFVRITKETCKIILICPSCHAKYDPDWIVEIHSSPQRARRMQRQQI
ncbi:MAG: hypothetical protein Q6358_10140 [Candidatus Brocadiales bacterium]|nr:hypothetical protein [Candidatus Brocadiales bacterium]